MFEFNILINKTAIPKNNIKVTVHKLYKFITRIYHKIDKIIRK